MTTHTSEPLLLVRWGTPPPGKKQKSRLTNCFSYQKEIVIKTQLSSSSRYSVLFTSCILSPCWCDLCYLDNLDKWAGKKISVIAIRNPQNKGCMICGCTAPSPGSSLLSWPMGTLTGLLSLELSSPSLPPRPFKPPGSAQSSVSDCVGRFRELLASKDEWRAPAWWDELFLPYLQPQRQPMTGAFPQANFFQLERH